MRSDLRTELTAFKQLFSAGFFFFFKNKLITARAPTLPHDFFCRNVHLLRKESSGMGSNQKEDRHESVLRKRQSS